MSSMYDIIIHCNTLLLSVTTAVAIYVFIVCTRYDLRIPYIDTRFIIDWGQFALVLIFVLK